MSDQTKEENWDWQELRRVCAEILGNDQKTWPDHGNVPLAIAAGLQLVVIKNKNLSEALRGLTVPAEEILQTAHITLRDNEVTK